jgi:hypothetical protein
MRWFIFGVVGRIWRSMKIFWAESNPMARICTIPVIDHGGFRLEAAAETRMEAIRRKNRNHSMAGSRSLPRMERLNMRWGRKDTLTHL